MEIHRAEQLLPDVILEHYDKRFVIKSGVPLCAVSSAIYHGGRQENIRSILNLTVDKGYRCSDPVEDLQREVKGMGLPERTIGVMTAVDVKNAVVAMESVSPGDLYSPGDLASHGDLLSDGSPLRVAAVVTAGVSNAWRAGVWPSYLGQTKPSTLNPYPPGTINMIVLIEGELTDAAMVNAAMTVTEAKTAIFYERGIRCPQSGEMATGTTTDAVVIATTGRGEQMQYAGPGTAAGALIARAVTRALNEALDIWDRGR